MEPTQTQETAPRLDGVMRVHDWRAQRLRRLGVPDVYAEVFADLVDWHAVADLVGRGCPPTLALRIAH